MKLLAAIYLFIGLSASVFGQEDDSWREASQEVKDSIDAIGMSTYASDKAKLREPIDNEVHRINSLDLDSTYLDFPDLSTEGGELHVYKYDGQIVKLELRLFGETYQAQLLFYLRNGKLFSMEGRHTKYNAPITSDEFSMEDSKEDQFWTIFKNRELLDYQLLGDCGAPWQPEFIKSENEKYISIFDNCMNAIETSSSEALE
ncbi:MAG: hypothetical protein HWE14_14725 [Flavobacteriia bacterium]|nr:hypothetical protein [Flavobacteriia bacterium]